MVASGKALEAKMTAVHRGPGSWNTEVRDAPLSEQSTATFARLVTSGTSKSHP